MLRRAKFERKLQEKRDKDIERFKAHQVMGTNEHDRTRHRIRNRGVDTSLFFSCNLVKVPDWFFLVSLFLLVRGRHIDGPGLVSYFGMIKRVAHQRRCIWRLSYTLIVL